MFPLQNMDKFLKLKLEMAYRGLNVEEAKKLFEQLKMEKEAKDKK